jgi:putative RecB family exonuclease
MTRKQVLQHFEEGLHISYSQIFTYLNCSLLYKFRYVESRPVERTSSNLFFGSVIHTALERYYRSIKDKGIIEPLTVLEELFEDCLTLELDNITVPVIYKKEAPDRDSLITMGKGLLKAFYENVDLSGMEIVDVELPIGARLFTDEGEPTDFMLVGFIDLLLMNENRELIIVDNKTAAKPMSQKIADDSDQMTAYSYLLASNKYIFPTAPVKCRFDLLRKLKKPKIEYVQTIRTAQHRKRFAKIANAVLAAIDANIFLPQPSWMCSDCGHTKTCNRW